jgi:hypothetical protein
VGIVRFLGIAVIGMLAVRVVFVGDGFVILVVGVLMAPSKREGTGATGGLGDSLVSLTVKVSIVGNVAIDHAGYKINLSNFK